MPIANFYLSKELLRRARDSLVAIVSSSNQPYFPRTLYVLRFSTRNEELRRRFIAHEDVIRALLHAMEWAGTTENRNENLFPLVMDSLCSLINDGMYDRRLLGCFSHLVQMTNEAKSSISSTLCRT